MKIYTSDDTRRNDDMYAVLVKDSWDDYGVQAAFDFFLFIDGKKRHIGEVKIISENKHSGRVAIKDGTSLFPSTFCSLGQSPDYYKTLRRLGSEIEEQVLTAFRDCAYDPQIYEDFKDLTYFSASLIRFTRAEQALQYARGIYSSVEGPTQEASYSFEFKKKLPEFKSSHILNFEFFDPNSFKIPSNINVVIGRNGSGKTQILSDLAKAISGYGYDDLDELMDARTQKFPTGRPNFGNTIVVSYSAFDMFEIPGKTKKEIDELRKEGHIFGYKYCGLRERTKKMNIESKALMRLLASLWMQSVRLRSEALKEIGKRSCIIFFPISHLSQ